jgi:hypothetical protein
MIAYEVDMGRKILGVIVALILAGAIFLIFQMIATMIPPFAPKNLGYMSAEERASYFGSMPAGAYVTTLIGYFIGSIGGGWIVTKISKQRASFTLPLIVGVILTIGGIINFFIILPGQPLWFVAISMISYIPLSLFGHRLAR